MVNKDSRSKNASRNIVFALIKGILNTILPFITRTIILYLLGSAYLGIGTLFTSILSMLNLTELGLSSAINYAMYKPIAEKDDATISALLNYYRKLYRIVGIVMLIIGTVILPVIPMLIRDHPPAGLNIYALYYIYLINTVISYFFAGYRHCLLSANQRSDITSKITMAIYVFNNVVQIAILASTKNYYLFAFVPVVGTLLTNICNYVITKRMYPEISCRGELDNEIRLGIKKRISGLFGTKLNSIVVHQADTLVISAFLGLTMVAEYGNYYYIMNAVCAFTTLFFSSITASVGNKLATDTNEHNYTLFQNISFMNAWLVGFCSACFLVLFQPFMELWVGKDLMQPMLFVVVFTLYFYIYEIQRTILTFKDAAGLWFEDRARPYVTMVFNVISNIVLVQFIGLYGIVISTILAFCISLPWANHVLFRNLFQRNPSENLTKLAKYAGVSIAVAGLDYVCCMLIPGGVRGICERLLVTTVLVNGLYFLIYRNTAEFSYMKKVALKLIGHTNL